MQFPCGKGSVESAGCHFLLGKPFGQFYGSRRNRIGRGNYRGGGKGRIWGQPERTREKKRGMGEYGGRRKGGRRCLAQKREGCGSGDETAAGGFYRISCSFDVYFHAPYVLRMVWAARSGIYPVSIPRERKCGGVCIFPVFAAFADFICEPEIFRGRL